MRLSTGSAAALILCASLMAQAQAFPVKIEVDAANPRGAWAPTWRFFGADEPNYATMKDGRQLLSELGELDPEHVYFRAHNLLCTGDGTPAYKWGSTNVYTEDATGRPLYDWTILDRIFDTYRASALHPYVEVGFMPEALSTHPVPYQHGWRPGSGELGTGWSYPPTDYARWAELVYRWVRHCADRYGEAEVARWYWEVWNEANLAVYWHGTPQEFFKLHDYATDAIRRALPQARVGGPDCAGGGSPFLRAFLEHCAQETNLATGRPGTPLDFISFHAKGRPEFWQGHVRMGIAAQLQDIDRGFTLIAAQPAVRSLPIIIGESDPDGCAACVGPQLGYRPKPLYASYTAACLAREFELAEKRGVNLQGALTWAFEFEDQPFFSGQRVLATEGIDLPILNLFRLVARMSGQRVTAVSTARIALQEIEQFGVRASPDVGAMATVSAGKADVLVWHYFDDDVAGPPAEVTLHLRGLPACAQNLALRHYRIDEGHSDAYDVWRRLGSPPAPDGRQYDTLRKAGKLALLEHSPAWVHASGGEADLHCTLPRQAVSLIELTWQAPVP